MKIMVILMVGMLFVGFIMGYAINSQARIDAAYNTCALECNEIIKNMSPQSNKQIEVRYSVAQDYLGANTSTGHG